MAVACGKSLLATGSDLRLLSPEGFEASTGCGKVTHPWFALQVRGRYENYVATFLHGKGYEWFLPLYKSRRRWSDRIKELELPLFPGYVFCRFNLQKRLPVLLTPGVIRIVGIGRAPLPIDEEEITAIQTVVNSGLPTQPWQFLQIGQRVRIEYGALCGLEGILLELKGHHRIVVSVTLLQRSVAVEIDTDWVSPIRRQYDARTSGVKSSPLLRLIPA